MTSVLPTLDLAAQAATIFGLILAFFAFLRERRDRKSLERVAQIRVWSDIARLRALMTDLEKPTDPDGFDFGKHQAVGKLTSMYRDKVSQVFQMSDNISAIDIQRWRKTGKICSDWQESCFWEHFPQDIDVPETVNSRPVLEARDELPSAHSMAARPIYEKTRKPDV